MMAKDANYLMPVMSRVKGEILLSRRSAMLTQQFGHDFQVPRQEVRGELVDRFWNSRNFIDLTVQRLLRAFQS